MATKKRKARGGELWAVICKESSVPMHVSFVREACINWRNWRDYPKEYAVRKILWRIAPRGKRGN